MSIFIRKLNKAIFGAETNNKTFVENMLTIESTIDEIDRIIQPFAHSFSEKIETKRKKGEPIKKDENKIIELGALWHNIKKEFGSAFTNINDKTLSNIDETQNTPPEVKQAIEYQFLLIDLLGQIKQFLADRSEKNNQLEEWHLVYLYHEVNDFIEKYKRLIRVEYAIKEKIRAEFDDVVTNSVKQTINDSDGKPMTFWYYNKKSKKNLAFLQYLTLINAGQINRNFISYVLHKDNILDIPHYNIDLPGKTIHLVPTEYSWELEHFLALRTTHNYKGSVYKTAA